LDDNEEFSNLSLSEFFDGGQLTSLEEDLGDTKSEVLGVELQLVEESGGSGSGIGRSSGDVLSEEIISLKEFSIDDSVGETFTGNSDTFKDTIASKLVENDGIIDSTSGLLVVRDDATDEMRGGGTEGSHQLEELFLVLTSDSDKVDTLASLGLWIIDFTDTSKIFSEKLSDENQSRFLHASLKILLEGILVLVQPTSSLIFYFTSIMRNAESSLGESGLDVLGV
jgi:hypothetical protein